jgi:hypothetical protein
VLKHVALQRQRKENPSNWYEILKVLKGKQDRTELEIKCFVKMSDSVNRAFREIVTMVLNAPNKKTDKEIWI